jgi:BON domain
MKSLKIYVLAFAMMSFVFLTSLIAQENQTNKSDEEITKEVQQKIKDNLFYTVFDWVTVKTDNGVVTLDGYAHLPWAKKYFESFAKETEGVKSVNDNIVKVSGSDDIMYRAARAVYGSSIFYNYRFMKDPPVHIIVISNKIILEGKVSSELEKGWASTLVEWNTDVGKIENNLTVERS